MLSHEAKVQYLKKANQSLIHFALAFFPEAFKAPFCPSIHYPMVRVIEAPHINFSRMKAVAAPRGVGKSTLGNTVNVVRRALMKYNNYILIVSFTEEQAIEHLKTIKKQLLENERIVQVFGDLQGETWKENEILLSNGVKIKALGSGQQVRGRRDGFNRPDYCLLDDFEAPDSVASETILARMKAWWSSDLRNSLDMTSGEELMLGTVLGDNAILQEQLDNPLCQSVRLELFDEHYQTAWPEMYPTEKIQEMRQKAENEGTLDQLWADYRNIAVAGENRKFDPAWFRYWTPGTNFFDMQRYIIVDPAKTRKTTSDYSAVHVVAMRYTGEVYDIDYDMDRRVNEGLYDKVLEFARTYGVNYIYVETNGLEDYIVEPLGNYLRQNGHPCYVEGIHASVDLGSKQDRIQGLIPLYKMGLIYHNPEKHEELENQLKRFPKSKYDDVMDCLAYVTKIQTDRNIGRVPPGTTIYQGSDDLIHRSPI